MPVLQDVAMPLARVDLSICIGHGQDCSRSAMSYFPTFHALANVSITVCAFDGQDDSLKAAQELACRGQLAVKHSLLTLIAALTCTSQDRQVFALPTWSVQLGRAVGQSGRVIIAVNRGECPAHIFVAPKGPPVVLISPTNTIFALSCACPLSSPFPNQLAGLRRSSLRSGSLVIFALFKRAERAQRTAQREDNVR